MCTRELYNMGITWTKEEAGLVSGGKGWFPLVSGEEGLVSAGFRVGRTGFGWFQGGNDWFRLVSCVKDWFRGGFGSFRFIVTTVKKLKAKLRVGGVEGGISLVS